MGARRGDWPTPEEKLNALHEKLVAAVEELASSDAWHRMLAVAARFPTYSPSNILLIAAQRPDANRVAGLRTWASLGRHVNKGEHGIAILAPCLYRGSPDEDRTETGPAADRAPQPGSAPSPEQPGPVEPRHLRGFRVVHVFDLSQTDGEPLPDVAPELLRGQSPADLWDQLEQLLKADGYSVERGDCSGANGYSDYTTRTVRVRDDVDPPQAMKALIHEAAHVRAGHQQRFPAYHSSLRCRGIAEVEAESIAYLVAGIAGIDSTAYSVPYVANWSGADSTLLHDTAARVLTISRALATLLDPQEPQSDRTACESSTRDPKSAPDPRRRTLGAGGHRRAREPRPSPMIVNLTHFNLYSNALQGEAWMHGAEYRKEIFYAILPMFHAFGMTLYLTYGIRKQTLIVLFPKFVPAMILDAIKKSPTTVSCAVPPIDERTAMLAKERGVSLRSTIIDRAKELIITGGFNVAPSEVEAMRRLHPSVSDAAVVGRPLERGGRWSSAAVELERHATLDEKALRPHCREHLAAYKVPRRIVQIEDTPRSMLDKVLREQVREQILPLP